MNNPFEQSAQRIVGAVSATQTRVEAIPVLGILARAARAYSHDRCGTLAASLAYYALLALFPFMLFILALASPFLESDAAIRAVAGFVVAYVPTGAAMIRTALQEVVKARGAVSLIAALGFIWSASGVFDLIQLGINRAFCVERHRSLVRQRVVSFAMIVIAGALFALSFLSTTAIRVGIHYRVLPRRDLAIDIVPVLFATAIAFFVFAALYRFLPYGILVRWRDVWLGAFVAAGLWEIAKLGFAWYVTNFALLNLVYGSLGAMIALMIWGYVTAAIMLFGAQIVATQAGARDNVD
ncbi:MAG: YihY/virulence factor BrkB family protein [Chloroflexi bacterium]|nr:YihY/virulence factor BrkB family protein [Chloroflexota bacterium]